MIGHGSVQAEVMLELELRTLHLAQVTGSDLSNWAWLEHIQDFKARLHSDILTPTRPHLLIVLL